MARFSAYIGTDKLKIASIRNKNNRKVPTLVTFKYTLNPPYERKCLYVELTDPKGGGALTTYKIPLVTIQGKVKVTLDLQDYPDRSYTLAASIKPESQT